MKTYVNENQFVDDMKSNFSLEGSRALFQYLEELEEGIVYNFSLDSQEMQYDPVSFRCSYSEYESLSEIKENYSDIETLDDLRDRTTVIEIPNSEKIIIENY